MNVTDYRAERVALEAHLPAAVEQLGWAGSLVGPMRIVGRRVMLAAQLFPSVHALRQEQGWPPVLDRVEVATWSWPEFRGKAPMPAVMLWGAIVPARYWATARFAAAPFTEMCPTAVLMPRSARRPCVPDGPLLSGAGVVVADEHGVDVLREPARWATLRAEATYHRLALEHIYDRLLQQDGAP